MSRTIVVGGSVAGLMTALALSELDHEVLILERDANPAPDSVEKAQHDWPRRTVPQATHSHAFASLGVNLLRDRAPEVYAALVDSGAAEIRLGERLPPTLPDRSPRPGDERLLMLGCRRSTFEMVLRREVLRHPQVSISTGSTVRGLEVSREDGWPRVTGVRTAEGEILAADLVVDAAGRRSSAERWLAEAGLAAPTATADSCEITYYTRFYELLTDTPPGPLNRGFGAGGLWGHYTAVMFLGDNRTFSISIGVLPDDTPMKALRTPAAFTAALLATPLLAPWVAPGVSEPISSVHAMGGLDNSLRTLSDPERPPTPGLVHVGDSVCTTNPAYGRGVSLAIANAYLLADTLLEHPQVSPGQAMEIARRTDALFEPWFAESVQNDRGRAMLWRATVGGQPPLSPPPGVLTFGAVAAAAGSDEVVWRRLVTVMMSLAPPGTVYGDEEVRARVGAVLSAGPPPEMPAPSREELLAVVSAAALQPTGR
jgi:2-polyprenyl-6-methoxyphenol hydroxylase-like FAD-dependent oxidoreductase